MRREDLESGLEILRSHLGPLEKFIGLFTDSLPKPLYYDSGIEHFGFRYGSPDIRHFCLLKLIRAVSALNACIELVRHGYTQELYVLLRTAAEFKTHIEFALSSKGNDQRRKSEIEKHIQDYFADYKRNSPDDFKRPQLRQAKAHDWIGEMYSDDLDKVEQSISARTTARRLSNVYLNFSNYVHGRYPETMDLYGGTPLRFHLRGMSNTPKDEENFAILEAFVESLLLTTKILVQKLEMQSLVNNDPLLFSWYNEPL